MKLFDLHSHWGTQRGYPLRSDAELSKQKDTWNSTPKYHTEEEMAAYFRTHDAKVILDLGFTKNLPIAEARIHHDYAIETQARFPDAIFGLWIQIDPRTGADGVAEFRRCIDRCKGFVGICVSAGGMGVPASDPVFDPYYKISIEAGRPALVLVGYNGAGAGLPGGGGIRLDLCHPRYVDELAVRFPELTIIAGRPAWPWQDDMIAVMLHKPNVWNELHGWTPKYLTEALKHDIARRLRKRVLFGGDYPLFTYERLIADWRSLGYTEEVLDGVLHGNAERLFANFKAG